MSTQSEQPDPAVDPLVEAARELEAAKAAEAAAKRKAERAKVLHSEAHEVTMQKRKALAEVIVAEARQGRGNAEIRRITKYTRQRVQQICKDAGVDPAE